MSSGPPVKRLRQMNMWSMYDSQQNQQWKRETVSDVANTLSTIDPAVRPLFGQIEALVRLLMTIPCSNAEAERSFCSLLSKCWNLCVQNMLKLAYEHLQM